jgi:hypothetical protein
MKAAIFENPGLENLRVMDNIKEPQVTGHDALIKVKVAGINPIDNFVVSGALPKLIPLPNHIPGALKKLMIFYRIREIKRHTIFLVGIKLNEKL